MNLADRKLTQVGLSVKDLPRATAFYRDTLGLPFLFETNGMAFFQLGGGTRLMIGVNHDGAASTGILYFDAPDVPSLSEALEKKGVVFLGPAQILQKTDKGYLMLRAFRDPDGNALALMGVVEG
jgi:catechol 2,3-dioxygenase-like lactoylglutathione lyase family enzyme